jgi:hypothetical protein
MRKLRLGRKARANFEEGGLFSGRMALSDTVL